MLHRTNSWWGFLFLLNPGQLFAFWYDKANSLPQLRRCKMSQEFMSTPANLSSCVPRISPQWMIPSPCLCFASWVLCFLGSRQHPGHDLPGHSHLRRCHHIPLGIIYVSVQVGLEMARFLFFSTHKTEFFSCVYVLITPPPTPASLSLSQDINIQSSQWWGWWWLLERLC